MSRLIITTPLGAISLALRPDLAPATVAHIKALVSAKLFDGAATFYRSDFVIQCGLHETGKKFAQLAVNESTRPGALSNTRGAMSVAHWDVPDNGGTEFFISLKANPHLDTAYGGYCVFAMVDAADAASNKTMDAIATAVASGARPVISSFAVA